jgi:hypothetical protein
VMTPDISCASVWLQSPISGDATCGLIRISNSVRDRQVPTLSRAKPPRAVPLLHPSTTRGAVRRKAHRWSVRRPPLAKAEGVSPCGAPLAAILGAGTVLPGWDASQWLAIRRISPPSSHPRPAITWQSLIVGPDGDPGLPDACLRGTTRRRRIPLRFKNALEKRPSRTG